MRAVTITHQALVAIREAAQLPLVSQARAAGPNHWVVPLSDDTIARLEEKAFPGETISDTIVRICSIATTGGRLN